MSTTQNTTGSNTSNLQFNPAAQTQYNNLVSQGGSQLSQMIQSPFSNPMYSFGAQQSAQAANQAGNNNMAALNQAQTTGGLSGQAGQGFAAAQKAQLGRANASMKSQAATGNVLNALQRQQTAIGTGLSFSPQLTGSSGTNQSSTSMSGLGTWLPQLLGTAISAGTTAATAGAKTSTPSSPANAMTSGYSLPQPSYATPTSILPNGFGGGMTGSTPFGMPQNSSINPVVFGQGGFNNG